MNRWIAVSVFVAMFVVGFVLWPPRRSVDAPAHAGDADAPQADAPAAAPAPRARIPRVARVKSAPKPAVVRNTATPSAPEPGRAQAQDEAGHDTAAPTGGVDPTIPLTAAGISGVADKMRDSIAECVDAWTAELPDIHGRVVLAFQIGPDGIQDAWVMEHEQVPTAVLGCFSSAVYEQRWPAAPEGVEVTMPFEVDAGLEDDGEPTQLLDRR